MDTSKVISIGIVDDDHLFLQLLSEYLQNQPGFRVVYTARSGNEFLTHLSKASSLPHVLLLDLRMADGNGLEVLHALKKQRTSLKVGVMSSMYRTEYVGQMLKMGAHAFLSKAIEPEALLHALREISQKGHYWSRNQIEAMRLQLSPKVPTFHLPSKEGLTAREIEILRLVCDQMTTREIAEELFLSPKTIETHKSNLLMKTAVKNIVGLVIYAIQQQIINPKEVVLLER